MKRKVHCIYCHSRIYILTFIRLTTMEYGTTKRGVKTLIYNNYEYWMKQTNKQGNYIMVIIFFNILYDI